jgi:hypothetical protein
MFMTARVASILTALVVCGALALMAAEKTASRDSTPAPAAASNRIWSGLVLATNAENPKPAPPELQEFAPRMKRVFGYNQFQLAGSATQEITDQTEKWLVPSKKFKLGLKGRRALSKEAQGGFLLSLQLFQDERSLVDAEVKLAPGSPLFIRGPQCANGQLIIVLQVAR